MADNPLIHIINPYTEGDFRKVYGRIRNNPVTPEQFLSNIVAHVSMGSFAAGIFGTIVGGLLVAWIQKYKAKVETPSLPPPPKWVLHLTKEMTAAGMTTDEIREKLKMLWAMKPRAAKMAIFEKEFGVSAVRQVKNPEKAMMRTRNYAEYLMDH